MVRLENDKGEIRICKEVFSAVTGAAAMKCYGVKGMAMRSMSDGLVHLLRKESMTKGVLVTVNEDNTISVELHIIVVLGINMAALSDSIISEVRYVVGNTTGVTVKQVDIFIDSVVAD